MATDAVLEAADRLYGLPLPEFTPARDALAKELRGEDKAAAERLKKLRKPSVAAWAVNLLVRGEAEQVAQVIAVGEALREAQANLDGDELRALTRQRRQLTAAVTRQARALAAKQGQKLTGAVADQVEATLTAAMVDPRAAEAVASGLLVAALAATGVDEPDLAGHVALTEALGFTPTAGLPEPAEASSEARPGLHVVPDPEADAKELARAEEALATAEAEAARAEEAAGAAQEEVAALEARALQVQAEIDELRRRLGELEESAEEVDDELGEAHEALAEARAEATAAGSARDAAADRVARLRG